MTRIPYSPDYQPADQLLAGRVILVTGASDGIGRALAVRCASLGAQVILSGRSVKKLEAVYDTIVAAGSPRPSIAPLDLERADASHYEALVQAVRSEFGRLDGLAQLAGELGELAPVEHYDVITWMRVMHVNVNAPFILTRSLLPLLRDSPDASVVFTSSNVSQRGRAYWGAYCVSKFAIEGLMQVLADETDPSTSIRVNSVNPGRVRTRMRAKAYPAEDRSALAAPETVLGPFLYLLGPDGRGTTGQRLSVG
jgi:NAD(P)-dependent dehydrogenase (short-subunit alcohol dehydrogenase family)